MNFTKTILLCFTRNKSKKTNKCTKFKFKFKKYTLHHCVFNKIEKKNKTNKLDKLSENTIFYYLYTNNINSIKSSP